MAGSHNNTADRCLYSSLLSPEIDLTWKAVHLTPLFNHLPKTGFSSIWESINPERHIAYHTPGRDLPIFHMGLLVLYPYGINISDRLGYFGYGYLNGIIKTFVGMCDHFDHFYDRHII
jgi:hypothetical protein